MQYPILDIGYCIKVYLEGSEFYPCLFGILISDDIFKVGKLKDGFLQYFDCFHSYQYCPHSTNLLSHFKFKIFLTKEIREMRGFSKQFKCLLTGKLPNDEIHFGSSNSEIPTSPTFQGTFHAFIRSISKLGCNFIFGFAF